MAAQDNNDRKPEILNRKIMHSGKVLDLQHIKWRGSDGTEHMWETAERIGGRGAVLIIPRLKQSNRMLFIRQFRPPAEGEVVEFPAGLIDEGESPETAAFRELREETGYHGEIVHLTPPTFNSPGMTSETVYQVMMDIDEELEVNQNPQPNLEPAEHIEELLVPVDNLINFLDREFDRGTQVDSKVVSFILGKVKG